MKPILLFLGAIMFWVGAGAQVNYMISYPISFPTGDLHSYSSNVSFRGISLEFNKKTSPYSSAGIETGWNVFYQHVDSRVYKQGTASISGVQYRYTNAVPIIAGIKWYGSRNDRGLRPYIGVGLGTVYANRTTDFGLYEIVSDGWQFCIRPEVGLDYKFAHGQSLFLGAKYFWDFNTSELDGQDWLSVNIGIRMAMY